jgi:hypothetical protein
VQTVFTVWDDSKDRRQYDRVNKAPVAGAKVAYIATPGTRQFHVDAPPGGNPISAVVTPYAITVFVLEGHEGSTPLNIDLQAVFDS